MPHLSFEFSCGLGARADLGDLTQSTHVTLKAKGHGPVGGLRVPGIEVPVDAISDGANDRASDDAPLIPSLEVQEIVTRFSRNSWSTPHAAIGKRTHR